MNKKYQAPVVRKAFHILKLVAGSNTGMGISEIAGRLDISKSTVHGITAALEAEGALVRDPFTKRFAPGSTLLEIGRSAFSKMDLKITARPVIEWLMEKCQESVFLGIKNGDRVTIVDIVESGHPFKITSPVGTAIPLMAGAVGKVFMAAMSREEAEKLFDVKGLKPFTEHTITEKESYFEHLQTVREKGYATDDEEYIPGVRAVASIINRSRPYRAAVWVVAFKPDMDSVKMERVGLDTMRAAEEISRLISV